MQSWRMLAGVFVCLTLSACGGGGGGGGGNEPPRPARGAFTLSSTNVSFAAKRLGLLPAMQNLAMQVTGPDVAAVGAAYRNGVVPADWLVVDIVGSHPNFTVRLRANTTNLPAGVVSTTVSLGTADSGGNILEYRDVSVTYTVNEGVVITSPAINLNAIVGHSMDSVERTLNVSAVGKQWQISADVPWVTVTPSTTSGSGTAALTIDTSTLDAGMHRATVTAVNSADASDTSAVFVNLTMSAPTLTLSSTTLDFGGPSGLDMSEQGLNFSLDTGTNAYPWTVSFTPDAGPAWLLLSQTSGNASEAATTLSLRPQPDALAKGTHSGLLRLTATVRDSVIAAEVPVTLRVDEQRLWASANGVAFASFPNRSVLTRSVRLFNSLDRDISWVATSDHAWLAVTPSGTGNDEVVLTASPDGLATDTQYLATVTVESTDAAVVNQETIRVGLWVGSEDPQDTTVTVASRYVATNPVEPLVVSNNRGSSIGMYNAYTGDLLRTLTLDTDVGPMTFSSDGQTLFAVAADQSEAIAIDPSSGAVIRRYPYLPAQYTHNELGPIAYARPSGRALLLTGSLGEIFDVQTGEKFGLRLMGAGDLAVSRDGQRVYLQGMSSSPTSLFLNEIRFSSLDPAGVSIVQWFERTGHDSPYLPGNGQDIALSHDDARLYRANGAPYGFEVADPDTLMSYDYLPADAYPASVECSWRGWCVGTAAPASAARKMWFFDATGITGGIDIPGAFFLWPAQTVLSGDSTRVVTAIDPIGLSFLNAPD